MNTNMHKFKEDINYNAEENNSPELNHSFVPKVGFIGIAKHSYTGLHWSIFEKTYLISMEVKTMDVTG